MLTPPSPSTSPTLYPHDPTNSRKRQRSLSMESEASTSSPKRSASQDPQTLQSNDLTSTPPSFHDTTPDNDIDAYMAEQGEDNGVAFQRASSSVWTSAQKLQHVEDALKAPMVKGETWYIVSRRWYQRWRKAMTGEEDKEGRLEEKDVGPVDNSNLCSRNGEVTSQLIEHIDCEFVPEGVWKLYEEWYGPPKFSLPRKVIERGIMKEPTLELRPPKFSVYLLSTSSIPGQSTPPKEVVLSSTDTVTHARKAFAEAISTQKAAGGQYRVWRIPSQATSTELLYPVERLRTCGATELGTSEATVEEEFVDSGEAFVVEFMDRDEWTVNPSEFTSQPNGTLPQLTPPPPPPPTQPAPLFNSNTDFFSQLQQKSPPAVSTTAVSLFKSGAVASADKPSTSARPKTAREPGTLGLGNMGNTCFMNSALQCLVHTPELVDYFLTGVYQEELNPDNPLGMHSAIAQAFGAMLTRIWDNESTLSSYTPREFKQTLQRFAPQFSGYQQHDSQELVAFLLDGLHEDLNRVLKKPYVEKPDWEGGGDKELVELANLSWEGYMKRNDSVVVDLFQGQYQSTLVCPECNKVSITFDPFMYLTLPLPVQKKWQHDILYVPWDLEKPHVKIPIEITRDASFKAVRQLLGRWMNSNPENLLTLEIFNHRFYKNLDDTVGVDDMSEQDTIVCFELPCNAQQSRTYKPQPNDPFIVPVFASETTPSRAGYGRGSNLFASPFVVVITQEQAKDPEAMYDAVVDRLQRWTIHARDLFTWEAGSRSDDMEPVHIPISGSPVRDTITEIKENGDIVTVEERVPDEGDIADEKATIVQQADEDDDMDLASAVPRKVGFKRDLFQIRVHKCSQPYGVGYNSYSSNPGRYDTWEQRAATAKDGVLLRQHDAFYLEFDNPVKTYYFGDESNHWEYALWNKFDEFVHPELVASRKAASTHKKKGITLQDCLDEFTKEEKLGEDDLWYCPRCKKHQQATKRFDLWKVPDILVVHLKRFSNSRMLRDKIDTFVDFPLEGLDLTSMVGERSVGKRLQETGVDVESLGLHDLEEPLVYDLFAVDEHLGGLGGGHYRAYALNHATGKWYHFDDSYVTPARPEQAVNSNAYLLFYRRRTRRPIGGKSHEKVEAARVQPKVHVDDVSHRGMQIPTPPSDGSVSRGDPSVGSIPATILEWPTPDSMVPSSPSSPPPPLEGLPPSFDDALYDPIVQSSPLAEIQLSAAQLEFPDPSSHGSPSSVDAEPDLEDNDESPFFQSSFDDDPTQDISDDSVRLRKANFSDDDDDEVVDDATDVIMTPAESELDETENDGSSSR
ncbi:cysteine proteinase [Dichomitus squalens LYAD-421 SS1]|uniref:cysteine proteinase n=1 Tax=Dichomitus squalens (strain LYAD-421) TaxID=732165 RepID=UPI0004412FB4|nr:cysteine proteinase [Dichomitus squalens LYAD-421 SS1]EJF64133.1 cysteine proteinase [Dichomitus squalens LYAD-421 SS1]